MRHTAHFKVFCLECYKNKHQLKGIEAFKLFKEYGVLDYLSTHYDVLHTLGASYLVEDIEELIAARR